MIFALAGNQNSGKTTLFNQLTGSNQHTGNFPGLTVDMKEGLISGDKDLTIADLPGIYSLRPYSSEEIITRDYILNNDPDAIIDIVDATNIERNLYLTLQLVEMGRPVVLALNMMDEVRAGGGYIDIKTLSEGLGIPVVPIVASKGEGVSELRRILVKTAKNREKPKIYDFCRPGPVHRCIHAVTHVVEDHAQNAGMSPRFAAMNFIEGNSDIIDRLSVDDNEKELIEHSVKEMEDESGLDRNAAIADMRYSFIEELCSRCVKKPAESPDRKRSEKIDSVLLNKYCALPVFALIMIAIFYLTFNVIGAYLSDLMALGIDWLTMLVDRALTSYGLNPVVKSMVIDGVFSGVGSVLSFIPIIVTLFFFLSMLEDTGYMTRIAFVMDRPLRAIGLSGQSIVPLLIGFGCTVPAAMASRTLGSERDRHMAVFLTPFMSCSAKIPIYTLFTAAFFTKIRFLVMACLYFGGIFVGIIYAILAKRLSGEKNASPFVMEMPNYRMPSAKTTYMLMKQKAMDFVRKAFTIIFMASIVIWFLNTFDSRLNVTEDSASSLLGILGSLLAPFFAPIGLGDWRICASLTAGFAAKEAVVSTLQVLMNGQELSSLFTNEAAGSMLAFTLLYTPWVAAVAAIKRDLGSTAKTIAVVAGQCAIAYVCAGIVYYAARLF